MLLSKLIESLHADIGTGKLNEATIRNRLSVILDQTQAVEAEMKRLKTSIKNARTRIQKVEIKESKRNREGGQDRLEEEIEKLLQVLSRPHRPSLEQAARELGIKQIVAEYHANTLVEEGMIELSAFAPSKGMMYSLTPKGTAYIVENNLADWAARIFVVECRRSDSAAE